MKNVIRIGTRSSQLALWQAEHIAKELKALYPKCEVELVEFSTKGDRMLGQALAKIGGKGLFTKELEDAMLAGDIDMAVHSLKDMPTELPEGLILGAVTKREVPYDALISPKYKTLDQLPKGAKVGTSSLRRQAQLLRKRPDLSISLIRGNVNTRLRKLKEENFDGIILAQAGLKRLGLEGLITEVFPTEDMLPAVGQGALAIECSATNREILEMLRPLIHEETLVAVTGERSFLRELEGGCQVPMGVYGICQDGQLTLNALISSLDGKRVYTGQMSGPSDHAELLGRNLAKALYDKGGKEVVEELIKEGILK